MRLHAAELNPRGVALSVLCGLTAQTQLWAADGLSLPPAGGTPIVALPDAPGQLLDFNIPAQPLADALKRYAVLSNWPTLFQSAMVAGRTSSAVRGRYSPAAALRGLLEGTGLIAEKLDTGAADAFILKEISVPASLPRTNANGVDFDYGGLVQAGIWQALCANPLTATETYRSLLRFRVDTAGHIQQARQLGSTGDATRDSALLRALQSVQLDRKPPLDMAQPLTMLILPADPQASDAEQRCGSRNGGTENSAEDSDKSAGASVKTNGNALGAVRQ